MRIGFACKYFHPDRSLPNSKIKEIEQQFNFKSTTAKWLSDNRKQAQQRIDEIIVWNANCVLALVKFVASYPNPLRMLRLGSDIFPFYTHRDCKHLYKNSKVLNDAMDTLAHAGKLARHKKVKLSFHPGQFCVLASDKSDVIDRSIEEFEYHADIIRAMGYGKRKLDFKCNVHLSGRGGVEQFRATYKRLSKEAKRSITLENDEYTATLDDLIPLADKVGIVLDLHHYWIYHGDYIRANDPRLRIIEDSWEGKRPTLHYSYSRHDYVNHITGRKPDMDSLLDAGLTKAKLRAHSDFYPNPTMNRYVLDFLPRFDIMCEAKSKNVAALQLYNQAENIGIL